MAIAAPLPAVASTGSITGAVFDDSNRDGVRQASERPLAGHVVFLFRAGGQYLTSTTAGDDGAFRFDRVDAGTYWVEAEWDSVRRDWVPTTTPTLYPRHEVNLSGAGAIAQFGFRRIVRSTDLAAPITQFVGANGLHTASYNDVVSATEIYDALLRGTVGAEASGTKVFFGYADNSSTTSSVSQTDGRWHDFSAGVYVSYLSWLDHGDRILSHEYGHAWSLYHAYVVQQEPQLAEYLRVRGLSGDPRLNTSHSWSTGELIAEDYRTLLGSPTARTVPQENTDIPPAADVPGLLEYLRDRFTTAPTASSPEPTPSPTPTATAAPSPTPEPSPTPTKGTKGGGGGKPRR